MDARRFLLIPLIVLALAGCAIRPPDTDPEALAEFREANDPIEPTNRVLFAVHEAVDRAVLHPVAEAYRAVVPQPIRAGVRNVLGILRTPVILVNDVLQGETTRARVQRLKPGSVPVACSLTNRRTSAGCAGRDGRRGRGSRRGARP